MKDLLILDPPIAPQDVEVLFTYPTSVVLSVTRPEEGAQFIKEYIVHWDNDSLVANCSGKS